jgi:hypothetical protein
MAQVANNNIYRLEWQGAHTGWDYRLDIIIPPEDYLFGYPLNNPALVPLPIGAVVPQKLTIKYSDYFGAPEVPTLDLNIDLLEIPTELAKALTQPALTYASTAGNIEAGVIFNLYIKYNGNDSNSTVNYRLAKSFIHYADGKFKYQPKEHTINIQAIDLNFAILRALSFKQLKESDFAPLVAFHEVIELYSYINSEDFLYYHSFPGATFYVVTLSELILWVNANGTIIKKLLTRDANQFFSTSIDFPTLYRQTSNADGSKGDPLTFGEISLLAYIKLNSDVVGGLFYEGDEQSLQKTYPNSVADFYNELAEFSLRRIHSSGIWGIDTSPADFSTINLDVNQLYDVSFSVNEERIKTVTCSLYEHHDDQDTGGDIDKREATIEGSRNEGSWTIPIVFNNILTNIKREGDKGKKGNTTLIKNLYYLDNYFLHYADLYNETTLIVRVHEYVLYELKYYATNNPTSPDYYGQSLVPRNYSNLTALTAMGTQTLSGIPEILSQFALRCLKGGTDVLECTLDLNNSVSFPTGDYIASISSLGNPWLLDIGQEHIFNLTNYDTNNSYLNYLANNWKLLESEIDFITELVKTKFIRLKI